MFIKKNRGKRVMRRRRTTKKSVPKVSKVVRKYVKKEIAKQAENKVINIEQAREFGSYLDSNTMNAFPLTPYITLFPSPTLGVNSNQRIGNECRTRRVTLNYVLRPTPYNATFNPLPVPVHVQFYLGYVKQASGVLPVSADFTAFYQNGSSSLAPSATLSDLIADVNTDKFTILKSWVHKIGFQNSNGTGANVGWSTYSNNDFRLNVVKKMDITKMYPKILRFDDATQSLQGRGLFMWYQAVSANGLALAANIRPVAIDFWVKLEFEDN